MNEDVLKEKLEAARRKINLLPPAERDRLLDMLESTRKQHDDIQQNVARALTALQEWRLHMKYLIFDREATRRERDELQRRQREGEF